MKQVSAFIYKFGPLVGVWLLWWWALDWPFSAVMNAALIIGCPLLVYPIILWARRALDRRPTLERATAITTFVHYSVGGLFGVALIRAITTQAHWHGWTLPLAPWIGQSLCILTGIAALFSVFNLALKGSGAPFAIALSERLAVDWMYAWTRNPMVLAGLACLFTLGLWFQSALFLLWGVGWLAPSLLFFVKRYEERELEIRFGAPYLEYKKRTPMLIPRKPRGK